MCPTSRALGALRVAGTVGVQAVQVPPGNELTRALDVAARVMSAANDRMAAALAATDLDGWERASLAFDAAEARYDELCCAASEAGYLGGFAAVPEKPAKLARFTRRDRAWRRLLARLRHPLGPAAAH